MYSTHLAEFVETFVRVLGDPALPHLFFVEGGALAVENALKAAFDWKSRRNEAAGRSRDLGTKVLHLTHAFHGRSGYTMSLTNTDPTKTDRFPNFGWPRIDTPAVTFPIEDHLAEIEAAEAHALAQAKAAFEANPHDIACFIAEPIQGEGGDNHLRAEFLQAMQAMCHTYDALFVLDEVQTGVGLTGTPWVYQQLGLEPGHRRVRQEGPGRRHHGRPADRRGTRQRLRALEPDQLHLGRRSGRHGALAAAARDHRGGRAVRPRSQARRGPSSAGCATSATGTAELVSNVRGRGLMCAIDLPDGPTRDA